MALMAVSHMCGAVVDGADGEKLGSITDVMVDTDTGRISYVVFAYGGVLGVGEKLFAVPWEALEPEPLNGRFKVQVDAAALDAAEGIDKDAWPAEAAADWLR